MVSINLVGFLRKSNGGKSLKMNISTEAFAKCQRYTTNNGEEFVQLVVVLENVQKIIDGDKEVISIDQITD